MLSMRHTALALALLGVLALASSATAGKPVAQPLNPPPPDFLTCKANGNGTICHGSRTFTVDPYDTEFVCGSGTSTFDIWDQGIAVDQVVTRWYDAGGNLVRREIHEDWRPGQFSNPLTGVVIPYRQTSNIVDVLAVPGDFDSAMETTTGQGNLTVPGDGLVLQNSGRTVTGADGSIEFLSGHSDMLDYFVNGNAAAIAEVCSVLAG
jgi:hypothetical protein